MFEPCDCGSGKTYIACCGRLHSGAPAETAEALMRSRYSAFRRGDVAYLLKSWAPETRPRALSLEPDQEWISLKITRHELTEPDWAVVAFTAKWRQGRKKGRLSETSRFRREGQGWVYVDGIVS